LGLHEEEEEEEDEDLEEDRFVNLSLLSHIANRLRDRVPRGTHVKGSIPYPGAFTGKDIVVSCVSGSLIYRRFDFNLASCSLLYKRRSRRSSKITWVSKPRIEELLYKSLAACKVSSSSTRSNGEVAFYKMV
jgi:hypothetical protein